MPTFSLRFRTAFPVFFALVGAGCQPSTPVNTGLPCPVQSVLTRRCQGCHAASPVAGAPMPLVTWENTQRTALSDPSLKVWQMMQRRINDPVHPMPPTGDLSAEDLGTLNGWLGADAPRGPDAGTCENADASVDSGPPVGPESLPCPTSERVSFFAHAPGSTEPFALAADAGNLYMCFTWQSKFATPTQATAFAPVIDDKRVVHHWILYETATAQPEGGAGPCHMPADAQFLSGWAPGGGNRELPPDVGQSMPGTNRWFILQVHYWNVARYTDSRDRSGVTMCTTTALREHAAAVHTLGSANIVIPARSTANAVGTCTPTNTEPVHVLSSSPHMHQTGTSFRTEILRGGDPARTETLVNLPRWDFQAQSAYPTETLLMPGDTLRTQCDYQNPTTGTITFGERTEDEMCFNFVLAWPAGSLVNANGALTNRCIDRRM